MLMKLSLTWPGWLIDFPVGDRPKLRWPRIVITVADGSTLARDVGALMILLMVMYPIRSGWSAIDDVIGDDVPSYE